MEAGSGPHLAPNKGLLIHPEVPFYWRQGGARCGQFLLKICFLSAMTSIADKIKKISNNCPQNEG